MPLEKHRISEGNSIIQCAGHYIVYAGPHDLYDTREKMTGSTSVEVSSSGKANVGMANLVKHKIPVVHKSNIHPRESVVRRIEKWRRRYRKWFSRL